MPVKIKIPTSGGILRREISENGKNTSMGKNNHCRQEPSCIFGRGRGTRRWRGRGETFNTVLPARILEDVPISFSWRIREKQEAVAPRKVPLAEPRSRTRSLSG